MFKKKIFLSCNFYDMNFLSILLLFSLSIHNTSCLEQFEIVNATKMDWKGGQKETGYGTYYEINILTKTNSENLIFDKLWIGEKYFEISCFQKGKRIKNNTFGTNDTITIQVNDRIVPKSITNIETENNNSDHLKSPDYNGDALLSYTFKGKRKYFEIEKFTQLETQYYP